MDHRRLENRVFVSLDRTNDRALTAPNTGRGPYLTTITCCV